MNPLRFRIRTMMVLIAVIAILIGFIAASGWVRRIREASVRIEGSCLWVRFELAPEISAPDESVSIILSHSFYVQIPLMSLLLLATIAAVPFALAVYLSARRRRRAEPRPPDR
jgi:hypothetical protein